MKYCRLPECFLAIVLAYASVSVASDNTTPQIDAPARCRVRSLAPFMPALPTASRGLPETRRRSC